MSYFSEVAQSRELLFSLSKREISGKYKRTFLGQLWSLANPLAIVIVYTLVFSYIFRIDPEPGDPSGLDSFPLWLLSGILPWLFFSNVLNTSTSSLVSNAGLIQKVYFPRVLLPLSQVIANFYNWAFEMSVLIILLLLAGAIFLPSFLLLVPAMILLMIFAAGLSMITAIANAYFRDSQHILTIALQFWFYLTPVIYPIGLVRDVSNDMGPIFGTGVTFLDVYLLNPMVPFIGIFREILYDNRLPDLATFFYCLSIAIVTFLLGFLVFSRFEKKLAEIL